METDNIDYSLALAYLLPNAEWAMDNNDYDRIQWFSDDIKLPTKAALQAAAGKAQSAHEAKTTARASALAKLAALGLTQEEIDSL
jgi:hypothetical protein